MLKFVFYYNHYNTLGHSTRVFSLIRGLKLELKQKVKILVLMGGKLQSFFPFSKYAQVVQLPYSIGKIGMLLEEKTNIYKQMIQNNRMGEMLKKRHDLIKSVLKKYQPQVFITEYFPFGKEFWTFEVPYVLDYIRSNLRCRIVGSSGYLSCIENTYEYIKDYYDALFIHSPEEFSRDYYKYLHKSGIIQINKVLAVYPDKVRFTGFVLEIPDDSLWQKVKNKYWAGKKSRLVLVSRGGGIVNKKIIIASILSAKANKDLFFLVCCGPATSSNELRQYSRLAKGMRNVKVLKSILPLEFASFLKAADVSVNMAGYNTTVKLLYYGKKTVLVPYDTYEQLWRADLTRKYLHSRIVKESQVTARVIGQNVRELLDDKHSLLKIDRDWFRGVPQTVTALKCLS